MADFVTVCFDANGGSVSPPSSLQVVRGQGLKLAPMPTREGYEFKGWYDSPNGGMMYKIAGIGISGTPINGDMTLYAHWKAILCKVIFNNPGGKQPKPAERSVNWGQQIGSFPEVSKKGHILKNWKATIRNHTEVVNSGTKVTQFLLICSAQWQVAPCYPKFMYASQGGA